MVKEEVILDIKAITTNFKVPMDGVIRMLSFLKMNMLGVMFFGMMLQRTFIGLLQPVMDAYGVFDLWNVMLLTMFLPIMEMVFPLFMQLIDYLMNLSDSTKTTIGSFAIFGIALGTILMIVGQLAIGFASLFDVLIITFGQNGFGWILNILTGTLLAAIIAVIVLIIAMKKAWDDNFLGMKTTISLWFGGIVQIFKGLGGILTGVFDIVFGLLMGDFDKIKAGIANIFKGILDIFIGWYKTMFGILTSIFIGVMQIIKNIFIMVITMIQDNVNMLIKAINNVSSMLGFGANVKEIDVVSKLKGLGNLTIPTTPTTNSDVFGKTQPQQSVYVTNNNTFQVGYNQRDIDRMFSEWNTKNIDDTKKAVRL